VQVGESESPKAGAGSNVNPTLPETRTGAEKGAWKECLTESRYWGRGGEIYEEDLERIYSEYHHLLYVIVSRGFWVTNEFSLDTAPRIADLCGR
jgi:hypothetical protein